MNKDLIRPDYLFEISWEVCNKVGGIYTVIATKSLYLKSELKRHHILIGPDVWMDTESNPDFIDDPHLYTAWRTQAASEGLRIRVGRWNIPGKPVAILVNFKQFITQKDEILTEYWKRFGVDSITGNWDYIESALFGYAAGNLRAVLFVRHKVFRPPFARLSVAGFGSDVIRAVRGRDGRRIAVEVGQGHRTVPAVFTGRSAEVGSAFPAASVSAVRTTAFVFSAVGFSGDGVGGRVFRRNLFGFGSGVGEFFPDWHFGGAHGGFGIRFGRRNGVGDASRGCCRERSEYGKNCGFNHFGLLEIYFGRARVCVRSVRFILGRRKIFIRNR